ncbi:MAG: B12-binding domain-containing radical SAM protein [Bacteroidales bacterium]|nr:B12-binding domain-containing radical SAM protein [Clostridium sp.]MCM1203556.1 B12-binding domain-containing radical SAM protein [Bacteroidales bacterium]
MKIILAALNAKYVHANLAVYDLEAYAREQLKRDFSRKRQKDRETSEGGTEPELVIKEYTINHNLDAILRSIYQERATVVAFSCYIWNAHEILTIAKELHKVSPDVRIWLGGPEVSYDSVNRLKENACIEGIMVGEGEATFYELVKSWNGDGAYADILGITYRDGNNRICQNPARPLIPLDDVPFIYRDLSGFQNKILYYETSRGCPFSCSYCLSSIDKQVRFRSIERVKEELQFFLDNRVPQVKFIDRTFNCKREHSLAIWQYIAEHDNGITNFHFEVAADLIGEEELAVFRRMRAGLIQLEIGLQSTNPRTIREIKRVMDIGKLKETMLTIRRLGNIHQHLDLIAGLPYEDFTTFKQSFNDAYEMQPNQLQLGFLKVLKGSYMEEQVQEYELQYQDFQPYEVLSTKWISYDEIIDLKSVEEMVEVYYNSDQFEHVLCYLIPFFTSAYAFYAALGRYYRDRQLFGIGFKREARYAALREFCVEWFGKSGKFSREESGENNMRIKAFSITLFEDLLTVDYYLRENAKSRPTWRRKEPVEKGAYHAFFKNGGTEEASLLQEGYDSRAAARMMHIEPVSMKTAEWLFEWDTHIRKGGAVPENQKKMYCLFDYGNRNPLSKDAGVTILSHL